MIKHEVIWQIDVAKILATLIVLGLLIVGYNQYEVINRFQDLKKDIETQIEGLQEIKNEITGLKTALIKEPITKCAMPIDCILNNTAMGCSKSECNWCCNNICTLMLCEVR